MTNLPEAGTELIISFEVGSAKTNLDFLLLGSSDQQNFALKPNKVSNGMNKQTVSFKLLSPLAEIEYFLLIKKDGQTVTASRNLSLERSCRNKTSEVDTLTAANNSPEQSRLLMSRIRQLQIDIENYQAVLHQLNKIKAYE